MLPFRDWLNHSSVTIAITDFMGLSDPGFAALGLTRINFSLPILNNPGIFPFIPIALIFLISRKTPSSTLAKITNKTINQLKNAVYALCFGVALVQVMRFTNQSILMAGFFDGLNATQVAAQAGYMSSMTTEIAQALAGLFGGAYPIVGPLIGALGAYVSGSHTVSNVMFYGLQLETAVNLGMPIVLILIGQTSGASIGNMVAINNAVAISATTGAHGSEGKLIAAAAVPFILCSLAISAIMFIYLAIGFQFVA